MDEFFFSGQCIYGLSLYTSLLSACLKPSYVYAVVSGTEIPVKIGNARPFMCGLTADIRQKHYGLG